MIEDIDYYWNEEGKIVLTAKWLLERGYCCGLSCLHCPYTKDIQTAAQGKRPNNDSH